MNGKTVIDDKFTIDDIGATLLNELSESLYEPEHVIREYVQNAVDAHKLSRDLEGSLPEEAILIQIRPDSISIIDYGIGMEKDEIASVKGISISKKGKKGSDLTGQKGVGIWSGLSFFEKMTIETTKAGINKKYILTIHFGNILRKLKSDDADTISVGQVLNGNHLLEEMEAEADDHGTTVTLHSPRDQASIFLDAEKIKESVRRYAPCEIDPDFKFYDELKKWYEDNNITFLPISVCGDDVYKSYHNGLSKFSVGTISVGDKAVVKYWLGLVDSNDKIKDAAGKISSGFTLIQNGFALDRNYGTGSIGSLPDLETPYVPWYVGEMHVTNEYVLPNLNRKGLQLNDNALKLIDNLREWYGNLDAGTRQISYIRKQIESYRILQSKADDIIKMIISDTDHSETENYINRFMVDYSKEIKRLSRIADISKYSDFMLHNYRVSLYREMQSEHKALNGKWNEIREDKIGLRTLNQIGKEENKSKAKGEKPSTSTSSTESPKPNTQVAKSTASEISIGDDINTIPKIKLTHDIAVSLLRESINEMDPPVVSTTVMERIIKNYSNILRKLVGDV